MLYTIVSFLGLVLGYILASKTKEEIIHGKNYFKIIAILLLILLLIILIKGLDFFNFEFFLVLVIGFILNYFIKRTYLFFGLSLAILNDKLLISLIIFIFGLTYGTLEYIKNKKLNYNILINFALFIIPIILLLNKFTMIFDTVLIGFAMGGILSELARFGFGFKKEKRASRPRQ